MSKKRMTRRVFAVVFALLFMITGVTIPTLTPQAATEMDLSSYITMSGKTEAAKDNGENKGIMISELILSLPADMDEKSEWEAKGIKSLSMSLSVSNFTAGTTGTPGAMMMFMSKDWKWNQGNYVNLTTSGTMEMSMDLSSLDWGNSTEVGKIGVQFTNLQESSTVTYQINSVKFSTDSTSSGGSGGSSGSSGTVTIPAGNVTDYNYSDIDYNYAKLLQYSLYFYDANMCGDEVGTKSLLDWRGNCHTYDKYSYTRTDGSTVTVDLTGGFHDAGDHVKFGLPEAYAAFVLGMSYNTNKSAYVASGQTNHLQTITTHFADYLTKCAVLNSAGTSVEAYCVQVGNGGGGYDHGYWGAPEAQPQSNRTAYFSSDSAPHTDVVSLSAAALAMQYRNFGGDKYLKTAEMLFAYAKNHNKSTGKTAVEFYNSTAWEDDYCLAALLLYQITGNISYLSEYNQYKNADAAMKPYWPLGWDNVGPAVAYYDGNSSKIASLMGISDGNSTYGGYRCVSNWGSARYNTSMQYTGLLYDKMTSIETYRGWSEGQMKYLLGNNAAKQCFVIGYNAYGPKYPHHRAASGYTGKDQGTTAQKNMLIGALVGGQKIDGSYVDSASDYVCNEVAIDYNATLVAAAAAIYEKYTSDTEHQYIDKNLSSGGSSTPDVPKEVAATGVALNKDTLSFEIGGTNPVTETTLVATVSPDDATDKSVTWSSSNNKVATVNASGKVTAVGAGSATITAKANGSTSDVKATCAVTVWKTPEAPTQAPSTSETPTTNTITLTPYDDCEYRIAPNGTWQDSNVFEGLDPDTEYTFEIRVKADADNNIRTGEIVTIKVKTAQEGEKIVEVTGVRFDNQPSEKSITIGDAVSWSFPATVSPANATDKTITYTSSNPEVAKIDATTGVLTAVAPGYTEISVTTKSGGYKDTVKLSVYKEYETPSAPTLASKTTTSVTLNSVAGCKYSKDGVNWQDSNVFTGLTANTAYTFYVKKVAKGYWLESDKSAGLTVTTVKETTGGSTGGNTGGNAGGSTGGNTGDSTDGSTGGNTGGSTGGNTGSNTGGNTGTTTTAPNITVSYRTHVQTFGWEGKENDIKTWKSNGTMSGTSGKAKRLEGINIVVNSAEAGKTAKLGIQYTTHCQSYGWLPWSANGEMNGTEGEAKRLEAIKIQLTGADKDKYDVYYRVHAQSYGWLGWAKNGAPSGTAGHAKRLEGIQIVVVKKGESAPGANFKGVNVTKQLASYIAKAGSSPVVGNPATSNTNPSVVGENAINVAYRTHVQSFGWQGWKYNGQMSGTSGLAKRLEGINIKLTNQTYSGSIVYTTHVQSYGWQGNENDPNTWKRNGVMSGTSGEAKRLEAIRIALTGEMAEHYDVYYRVHAQSFGWLGWAKNGEAAGTAGLAKRLEGIQIVLVPKNGKAPAMRYQGITSVKTQAYIKK